MRVVLFEYFVRKNGKKKKHNMVQILQRVAGSAIFRGFEAQKMTFVIDPDPRRFFFKCGGGGGLLKRLETSERDRKVQSLVHRFNKVRICIKL